MPSALPATPRHSPAPSPLSDHQPEFGDRPRPPGSSFTHIGGSRPFDRPSSSHFSNHDDDNFFTNTHRPSSVLRPLRPQNRPPLRPPNRRPPPFRRPESSRPAHNFDGNFSHFNRPPNSFNGRPGQFDTFDNRPHDFPRPGFSRPTSSFESPSPPIGAAVNPSGRTWLLPLHLLSAALHVSLPGSVRRDGSGLWCGNKSQCLSVFVYVLDADSCLLHPIKRKENKRFSNTHLA